MERWKRVNSSKTDLRFIIFDFVGGTVDTHDVTFVSGVEKISSKTENKFAPVTSASYDRVVNDHGYGFKRGQTTVMSITDIYAAVGDIGRTNPGTLVELSFFSHGWMGGPILVNSCDRFSSSSSCFGGTTKSERDPDDKDPRSFKDFISPTMSPVQLKQFRDAFHPNGFVWIWGCTFTKAYFWTLSKLIKKYGTKGLTDEKSIKLVYSAEEINFIWNCAGTGKCSSVPVTWDTDFKTIKQYICEGIASTYASVIAQAAGKNTYAALLGTYAVYQNGSTVRNPLMTVEGFSSIKNFYDNYLSMKLDPAGLGYGTYPPYSVC
jgi:hypothetical protein